VVGDQCDSPERQAIWYSVIFALYVSLLIATPPRNPWIVLVCVLWGLLTLLAWLGVTYHLRHADKSDSDSQR